MNEPVLNETRNNNSNMKRLIINILFFPLIVLPVQALTALVFEGVFGDLGSSEPGFDPVFWFIYTAP